jgi:O-acetyl-ADP-ribose deacetylase (regulator of RNase III)
MIDYMQGNLLDAKADALMNAVNEVGVMGKGIVLMFREAFPENMRAYAAACKSGDVKVGRMFVTETGSSAPPKWIINFPTKKHWRSRSKMEWVQEGLKDLVRVIRAKEMRSIAMPALGCGNGGLEWPQVKAEIEAAMSDLTDVRITIHAPTADYKVSPKTGGRT